MLSLAGRAQYASILGNANSEFTNAWNHTIVRNDNNEHGVGYIHDDIKGWLYEVETEAFLNPAASYVLDMGHKVPLPDDWFVCDMQIEDSYVYFCGSASGKGVFGYFRKNCLYDSSSVLIKYKLFDVFCNISTFKVYKRLGGEISFSAMGNYVDEGTFVPGYGHCLIAFPDIQYDTYRYTELPEGPYLPEIIQDIHKIGDTLVYVGMDCSVSPPLPCFRKAYANNILGTSDIRTIYHPSNNTPTYSVLSPQLTASAAFDNKYLMLAHQCNTSAPFSAAIFFNVIDIHSANLIVTQKYYTGNRVSLKEMIYVPGIDRAILNCSDINPNLFLVLNPFATTPYSGYQYETNPEKYASIDLMRPSSFIAAGESHWSLQQVSNGIVSCYTRKDNEINIVDYHIERDQSEIDILQGICVSQSITLNNQLIIPIQGCNIQMQK